MFHVMTKPVGSACNLRCYYCYYLPKASLLRQSSGFCMDEATLECFVREYLASQPDGDVQFVWQGGEPMLAGRGFYRKALALQRRYRRTGQKVFNALQTNGTLLDEAWCGFLREQGFVVGLSVDGPARLHDSCRVDRLGRASHHHVVSAARRLQAHAIPFATLTVVGAHNAHAAAEIYTFLADELGSREIQIIPCVEPRDFDCIAPGHRNRSSLPRIDDAEAMARFVTQQSVHPDSWGKFLCEFFDAWRQQGLGRVRVNLFESAVLQLLGHPALQCSSARECGQAVALEKDGRVYTCDHYVYPEYQLGQLGDAPLAGMLSSPAQRAFAAAKHTTLPGMCRSCAYLLLCWGECPRNRFVRSHSGEAGLNYLCRGQTQFFQHALPSLQAIAARVARAQK